MTSVGRFFRELRRRRVFRSAGIYIVAAWVLLQVFDLAFGSFGVPETALRYVWIAAIAGFPLALIFGWRYDVTASGIVRTLPADADTEVDLRLRGTDYALLSVLATVAVIVVAGAFMEIRQGPMRSGAWYTAGRVATAIAVLPLDNLSGDSAQDFLTVGLHDALISTLSRITRLRVISRYSSRRVDTELSLNRIGDILNIDLVLEGSVTREGEQIRVNVSLVDTDSEETLWSESYLREMANLIDMQNEIASTIAREVKVQLSPEEQQRLAQTDTSESDTYEAYLRGMFQLHRGSPRGYRRAIEIFTEAVENNPTSALAYAGLAIGYSQLGHSPYPVPGAYPRAREAAERALEFDPDLAEAHLAVGMYKMYYEWDFPGAEAAFQRALAINASLVDAHYHYAWLLEVLHRNEESIRYGEYTKELNPLSPFYSAWLADQYRDAGLFDKAIEEAQTTLALNPDYPVAWLTLGLTYLDMGRTDEAIDAHNRLRGNQFWGFFAASTLAAADGNTEFVQNYIENGDNNPFTLALIYASLEDREQTLRYIEECKEDHIPWYPWLLNWFSQTRFVHGDPRIRALAEEIGLPVAASAAGDAPAGDVSN